MTMHVSPPIPTNLPDPIAAIQRDYPKFAQMIAAGEPHGRALRYLGLALWQDNRLEDAVNVLGITASLHPNEPRLLAELGSLLYATGRTVEALQVMTTSLELEPTQVQVWLNVANLCMGAGETLTAEQAFKAALEFDPSSPDAAAGLGLLYIENRLFDEAAVLLKSSIANGVTAMAVYACLGQTLFMLGDFAGSAAALEQAVLSCPDQPAIRQRYAQSRFVEALIDRPFDEALALYVEIARDYAGDLSRVCRSAFQILTAYGHMDAAVRLGRELHAREPGNPVLQYNLDAVTGRALTRAPAEYVTSYFDDYADEFDAHLVGMLGYRLPEMIQPFIAAAGRSFASILDLGCGTGLAAPALASLGSNLTGVDISKNMLQKARGRGLYRALIQADAIDHLASGHTYDLVVSLDTVIYFGDLEALFAGVAASLPKGGFFVLSYEADANGSFALQPSGRFAHDPAYVAAVADRHFDMMMSAGLILRREASRHVEGQMILLQRR